MKWRDFVALYGTSEERLDILNAVARHFFWQLQGTLFEDVLLHLSRLTDLPIMGRNRNLTLRLLPGLVDRSIAQRTHDLLDEVVRSTEFARDWRNRRIAHADRELKLGASATPLERASRKHVEDAMKAVVALLNHVHLHYHRSEVVYDSPGYPESALELLYVLQGGLEAEAARRRSIRQGSHPSEDLNPRSI